MTFSSAVRSTDTEGAEGRGFLCRTQLACLPQKPWQKTVTFDIRHHPIDFRKASEENREEERFSPKGSSKRTLTAQAQYKQRANQPQYKQRANQSQYQQRANQPRLTGQRACWAWRPAGEEAAARALAPAAPARPGCQAAAVCVSQGHSVQNCIMTIICWSGRDDENDRDMLAGEGG